MCPSGTWASGGWHSCRSTRNSRAAPLYQALLDNLEDPILKGTGAGKFVGLIESFAAGYEGRPVSEVLSAILNESGYEKMLRTEGSQERLDNLAELKQSVYEYETTCGEEVTLEHYLARVALFTNADTGRAGRQGEADDRPRRQGPGVPLCVPLRHERGRFSPPGRCGPGRPWRRSGGWPSWLLTRAEKGAVPLRGGRAELRRLAPVSLPLPSGH